MRAGASEKPLSPAARPFPALVVIGIRMKRKKYRDLGVLYVCYRTLVRDVPKLLAW
jgi:hypothetical protein